MTIFERVRALALPDEGYAVIGGGVLEAHGLRRSGDVDLLVSLETYELLRTRGWQGETGLDGVGTKLRSGEAEAFLDMGVGEWKADNAGFLARAERTDGVWFCSLADTRAFKAALGRPKDLRDIALIDTHYMCAH